MVGCILRVEGLNLVAPAELGAEKTRYGFMAEVAHGGVEFKVQIKQAEQFLARLKKVLARIIRAEGVQSAELDFGVWNLAPEVLAQSYAFPAALVALAAECGVGLGLSMYLANDSESTLQVDGYADPLLDQD